MELDPDTGEAEILYSASECVSLSLPTVGSGSYPEILEYIREVLEQNTDLKPGYNPTGSFDKLAGGMLYSILHRIGIDWQYPEPTKE